MAVPKHERSGMTKRYKMSAADWVVIVDGMNKDLTLYQLDGEYRMIHTSKEHLINPFARVIHRSKKDSEVKVLRYDEGGFCVREETFNSKGELVTTRRYSRKLARRAEARVKRKGDAAA